MSFRSWFRPPRHLLVLFVVLTLVPSMLLLAFGWRLLQQDFELERKQIDARREQATDRMVSALHQAVKATETRLLDRDAVRSAAVTPDSITVTFDGTQLEALPYGRLLYHPASGTAVEEIPPELSARWARCGLLARQGQIAPLRTEALELRELLLDGRWKITRPVFEMHFAAASAWAGAGEPPASYRLALSEAVDRLWSSRARAADAGLKPWTTADVVQPRTTAGVVQPWTPAAAAPPARRSTITAGGLQFTILSQTLGARTNTLIAGPMYVEREWKSRIVSLEERHRVRIALHDVSALGATSGISRRIAADTGLPWTVTVRNFDRPPNGFGGRRRMWIGPLAILACLVLMGSYVAGRAMSRVRLLENLLPSSNGSKK